MTINVKINIGEDVGEVCNRNGCTGIIEEYEKEGCCSCHINPPCGYCTEDNRYCSVCDWNGADEQSELLQKINTKAVEPYVYKVRTIADLDNSRIDWIRKSHTHFSMIKEGVYPEGTTRSEVEHKVRGTFGGRFTYFDKGRFTYVAYTD